MTSQPARYTLAVPSGAAETSRLTLQHRIWVLHHNDRLHATPLDDAQPQHVLDLCCGTGIWTLAFASAQPKSTVLGIDISPPQPTAEIQAQYPNLEFAYGDAESDWDFAAGRPPFTFIYGRMLANSIRQWDHTFRQAVAHLSPGGYLQLDDVAHAFFADDVSVTEADSPMMRWWRVVFQAASAGNHIDLNSFYKHTGRIREAGFRFIRVDFFRWYFGGGQRPSQRENEIADLWLTNAASLISMVTTTAIAQGELREVTSEEAQVLASDALDDIQRHGVERGYYMEFSTHVAQRTI